VLHSYAAIFLGPDSSIYHYLVFKDQIIAKNEIALMF
jgi:hypothetical protein